MFIFKRLDAFGRWVYLTADRFTETTFCSQAGRYNIRDHDDWARKLGYRRVAKSASGRTVNILRDLRIKTNRIMGK